MGVGWRGGLSVPATLHTRRGCRAFARSKGSTWLSEGTGNQPWHYSRAVAAVAQVGGGWTSYILIVVQPNTSSRVPVRIGLTIVTTTTADKSYVLVARFWPKEPGSRFTAPVPATLITLAKSCTPMAA